MVQQLKKQLTSPDSLVSLFLGAAVVIVAGALIFNYFKGKQAGKPTPTEQKQEQVAQPTLPATHTVVGGETLWSIAEKYYQSGYNWVDIASASTLANPNYIAAGQTLNIPNVPKRDPGQISAAAFEVKKPPEGKYTVKRDDTLWDISLAIYGTGFRWVEIAKANNLANPDLIHAGNVFTLP